LVGVGLGIRVGVGLGAGLIIEFESVRDGLIVFVPVVGPYVMDEVGGPPDQPIGGSQRSKSWADWSPPVPMVVAPMISRDHVLSLPV